MYITNSFFFFFFFLIYVSLWDTAIYIKYIFFFLCLFFLLTITGRNEAIIVELKTLIVLNATFITFLGGSHHQISRNYEILCRPSPLIP